MCDGGLIIMGVMAAASAATSMYGQHQQASATEDAMEYNAKMNEAKADSVSEQASFEARQREKQNRQAIAKGIVSAAGSGIGTLSGSVMDWEGDMGEALGTDLAALEHNSELQRFGLISQSHLYRAQGKSAKVASRYSMASTAFSAIGSMAGGYSRWKNAGEA